jgi:hypothetical protein
MYMVSGRVRRSKTIRGGGESVIAMRERWGVDSGEKIWI